MKALYRNAVRNLLCTGLLLGSGAVALAQEPHKSTRLRLTTPRSTNGIGARTSRPQISKRTIVLTATSRSRFDNPS